jgi:uncharacterized SAM-binding protein YcdF (DUF218 family)
MLIPTVLVGLVLAMLWWGRHRILAAAGSLLIAEDPVGQVDVLVVSGASTVLGTVEVARLYREGVAPRILVPRWPPRDIDDEARRLDASYVDPETRVRGILERAGVPEEAIVTLPIAIDGTDLEAATVAGFVRDHGLKSLLIVTARTHGARVRWLLRRALPPDVSLRVRSPRADPFSPGQWWLIREQSREVVMEYLRWMNVLLLGDPWARHPPRGS